MSGKEKRALQARELAALELTITAMQSAGVRLGENSRDDNPREQWAQAFVDAHHPFLDLSERDREILQSIKELAGQLESRVTLEQLIDLRGQILSGAVSPLEQAPGRTTRQAE